MSIHFGTGGWRAIIGDDFTKANIRILAEAMARKMKKENARMELVIGYDRRFLAKEAVQWAAEVLAAEGITVRFVNRSSPTPLIMFYTMAHDLDYGMMVTASHNPSLYNGFKVFTKGGRDADEHQTADVECWILQVEEDQKQGYEIPCLRYEDGIKAGLIVEFNPLNEYLDSIISRIDMQAIRDAQSYAGQDQIRRDAIELLDESRKLCNETELSLKNAGKTLDRAAKKQIKADSARLQKLIGKCRLEKVTEAELAEIREAKQILQNSVDSIMRR